MHEKVANPPGNLANAAVYLFDPSVFGIIESTYDNVFDISLDIVPMLYGKLTTFLNTIYHRDIGTLESLAAANAEFESEIFEK
jgi:mannose-1-phosphate guanylyltransferase